MDVVSSPADFAPVARNPEGHIGAGLNRESIWKAESRPSPNPSRFARNWSIIVDHFMSAYVLFDGGRELYVTEGNSIRRGL